MKKISDYRKLLGVNSQATLAELKSVYRSLVKEWHPDRHAPDSVEHSEAEHKSKAIIEAYHFLVSVAPETKAAGLEHYNATTNTSAVTRIEFEDKVLEITFADGSSYEYFGVPKDLYLKLIYAPVPTRFARRHIVHSFIYRQATKRDLVDVEA
jgi:curved DNA-binding protein CbpA